MWRLYIHSHSFNCWFLERTQTGRKGTSNTLLLALSGRSQQGSGQEQESQPKVQGPGSASHPALPVLRAERARLSRPPGWRRGLGSAVLESPAWLWGLHLNPALGKRLITSCYAPVLSLPASC